MIITRAPLRIVLAGGGTDLPAYYEAHGGFAVAMGIDKHIHVLLGRSQLDRKIRVYYAQTEIVEDVSQVRHELVREALRLHGVKDSVEISSRSELPAGTGLGQAGAFLVALLAALHQQTRGKISPRTVAEEASIILRDVLGRPVGVLDEFMAAFGGLTALEIGRNGSVSVQRAKVRGGSLGVLVENLHLYFTGRRDDDARLAFSQQGSETRLPAKSDVVDYLHKSRELGHRIVGALEEGDLDMLGRLLDEQWQLKRGLEGPASSAIDGLYSEVRARYGVLGGKVVGARGWGFLLLYCPRTQSRALETYMGSIGMPRLDYQVSEGGVAATESIGSQKVIPLYEAVHEGDFLEALWAGSLRLAAESDAPRGS